MFLGAFVSRSRRKGVVTVRVYARTRGVKFLPSGYSPTEFRVVYMGRGAFVDVARIHMASSPTCVVVSRRGSSVSIVVRPPGDATLDDVLDDVVIPLESELRKRLRARVDIIPERVRT